MKSVDFFYGVSLAELTLNHRDNLSRALQKENIPAADRQGVTSLTVTKLSYKFSRWQRPQSWIREVIYSRCPPAVQRSDSSSTGALTRSMCSILKLLHVIHASKPASEHSFSTLQWVKSSLRAAMGQSRLNHLMIVHVHKVLITNCWFEPDINYKWIYIWVWARISCIRNFPANWSLTSVLWSLLFHGFSHWFIKHKNYSLSLVS